MKPRVYIETSILSYLTALPSRDVMQAARQQLTMRPRIEAICRDHGFPPPVICTPDELLPQKAP